MAQHAKLLSREIADGAATELVFEISDDTAGVLGQVTVPDGVLASVKAALRKEADRLIALPVGMVIDL